MSDSTLAGSPAKPDAKPGAREKIARLRASFLEQMPLRLEEARLLLARVVAQPGDEAALMELHRFFHSIKGTGRSFGFRDLGNLSGELEAFVEPQLHAPGQELTAVWLTRVEEGLSQMEVILHGLQGIHVAPVAGEVPGFTLPERQEAEVADQRPRLIYLCDDEPLQVEQLAAQLNCFGYQTVGFTNTDALRQAVVGKAPDAVVMDINFPGDPSAGTAVMRALRQELETPVPVVFLSSRNDFHARLQAVQAGGEAYFHKPARAMELVAVLDGLTRQERPEPYRILVVDDEPEIASYHSILLQEAGMVTQQVNDPARILTALAEFRPDMVLMDMYMPRCSGRELATLIRQMPDHLSLPIVFLSSETDKQKQFSAMRVGAEGFLTKPVVPDELVAAVAIRAERMRTLRSLMVRDSLTGLFNHTTTTQMLDNALANAGRKRAKVCFAMIDIDHFKQVNDTYGHPMGDQVLLALARVLQQRLRSADVVGRYGGEEFAIILQDIDLAQATRLLDQLRTDFAKVRFDTPATRFTCTFSVGVADYPAHLSLESLREAADRALYRAKRQGRNQVVADETAPGETPS